MISAESNLSRSVLPNIFILLIIISVFIRPVFGQNSIEMLEECNQGNPKNFVETVLYNGELQPLLFMANKECISTILDDDLLNTDLVFRNTLRLSLLRSEWDDVRLATEIAAIFANGTRLNFIAEDEDGAAALVALTKLDELASFIAAARASTVEELEQISGPYESVKAAQLALYAPLSTNQGGGLFLERFCDQTGRCSGETDEFCPLDNLYRAKRDLSSIHSQVLENVLQNCGLDFVSVTRSLRVIGVLDGTCSLSSQALALQNTKSIKESQCDVLLQHLPDLGISSEIDSAALLYHSLRNGGERYRNSAAFISPTLDEIIMKIQESN